MKIKDLMKLFPGDTPLRVIHEAEVQVVMSVYRDVQTVTPILASSGDKVVLRVVLGKVVPSPEETVAGINAELAPKEE